MNMEMMAATPQPAPTHNENPSCHDLVIADMQERRGFGLDKYGTILQPENGRDMLVDAYQEVLDLAVYLRGAIYERTKVRAGGTVVPAQEMTMPMMNAGQAYLNTVAGCEFNFPATFNWHSFWRVLLAAAPPPPSVDGEEYWTTLSCDAQYALATRIAANVGYVLVEEPDHPDSPHFRESEIEIDYTNYRGERSLRLIRPEYIGLGFNQWHPERQWLLFAHDVEKNARRTFALRNIHAWDTKGLLNASLPAAPAQPPADEDAVDALRSLIDAIDNNAVLLESADVGENGHPWHEEWVHNVRSILTGGRP